jgi:hypothetical protein
MDKLIINEENCYRIKGFKNYHISESGRIYRTLIDKKRTWRTKGKVYLNELNIQFRIQNGKLRHGYASLTDDNGKPRSVQVAALVAITFGLLPKGFNKKKHEIDYKDGDKKNLHYSNLVVKKRKFANTKLSPKDVKQIKNLIKQGIALRKIAVVYGVSEMQIGRIKTGENWNNNRRKIKPPEAPFHIEDGRIRKYIATFDRKKTADGIKKEFSIKRNPKEPTDNHIIGILNGYKLSIKHKNITRAEKIVEKLNDYFFSS